MLNMGVLLGALTGGFGTFVYGYLGGAYSREVVGVVDALARDVAGVALQRSLGELGVMAMLGVMLGSALGAVFFMNSKY